MVIAQQYHLIYKANNIFYLVKLFRHNLDVMYEN